MCRSSYKSSALTTVGRALSIPIILPLLSPKDFSGQIFETSSPELPCLAYCTHFITRKFIQTRLFKRKVFKWYVTCWTEVKIATVQVVENLFLSFENRKN